MCTCQNKGILSAFWIPQTALFTESVEPIAEQEDFAVDNSKALLQEETATDVQPIVDEVDKALTQVITPL